LASYYYLSNILVLDITTRLTLKKYIHSSALSMYILILSNSSMNDFIIKILETNVGMENNRECFNLDQNQLVKIRICECIQGEDGLYVCSSYKL
jgi:hypothetical protein